MFAKEARGFAAHVFVQVGAWSIRFGPCSLGIILLRGQSEAFAESTALVEAPSTLPRSTRIPISAPIRCARPLALAPNQSRLGFR